MSQLLGLGSAGIALSVALLAPNSYAQLDWNSVVSVDGSGDVVLNQHSGCPSISADGRYVLFRETGPLIPEDTNGRRDFYIYDRIEQTTELATLAHDGTQTQGGDTVTAHFSKDGTLIAFDSTGTNLVPGDTNNRSDIFVRDLVSGAVTRVSVDSNGVEGDNHSCHPIISGNGRFVTFESRATNLVAGDTNAEEDVFVHDLQTGITERVSVASNGAQSSGGRSYRPSISADGNFVAFASYADNLSSGIDSNGTADVFLRDRAAGTTELISGFGGVPGAGFAGRPVLSANGRFVAFTSSNDFGFPNVNPLSNNVFLFDRLTSSFDYINEPVGAPESSASYPGYRGISDDGRFVVFSSSASNNVVDDTNGVDDVFRRDRLFGVTERLSFNGAGFQLLNDSGFSSISSDGRHVAYYTDAFNSTEGQVNSKREVLTASPWINLNVNTTSAAAGDTLSLTIWRGAPGGGAQLFITAVDGAPFVLPLAPAAFDAKGNYTFDVVIPATPSVAGVEVTFRGFGVSPPGGVRKTQEVSVSFE